MLVPSRTTSRSRHARTCTFGMVSQRRKGLRSWWPRARPRGMIQRGRALGPHASIGIVSSATDAMSIMGGWLAWISGTWDAACPDVQHRRDMVQADADYCRPLTAAAHSIAPILTQ